MAIFGVCTSITRSADLRKAGWDFVEENVQGLFRGQSPDSEYTGQELVEGSALPVYAANCLVPGGLKITGPAVDMEGLSRYMVNVLRRAAAAGCRHLVFGSGGARQVPADWDKARATQQIIEFGRMAGPIAQQHGVTLVLEHLCIKECNIINDLIEELTIIREVNSPGFKGLLDTYHFWMDGLRLATIEPLLPHIHHVHVADREGRVVPGQSGSSDYRPIFRMLKQANYDRAISVEAGNFGELADGGAASLAFLKEQWATA